MTEPINLSYSEFAVLCMLKDLVKEKGSEKVVMQFIGNKFKLMSRLKGIRGLKNKGVIYYEKLTYYPVISHGSSYLYEIVISNLQLPEFKTIDFYVNGRKVLILLEQKSE